MPNVDDPSLNVSRRDFARTAALAATAACVPGELFGASAVAIVPPDQAATQAPPAANAEVEEKVQAILRKYGSRFSEEQKAEIRRLTIEGLKPLEAMRKFALENSDQPANVMKIYPDAEQTDAASSE